MALLPLYCGGVMVLTIHVLTPISPPPDHPVIYNVDQLSGTTTGGTKVTITGYGFGQGPGGHVYFGGHEYEATIISWSSTWEGSTIECLTPAHDAGVVIMQLVTFDGDSPEVDPNSDEYKYTYRDPVDISGDFHWENGPPKPTRSENLRILAGILIANDPNKTYDIYLADTAVTISCTNCNSKIIYFYTD